MLLGEAIDRYILSKTEVSAETRRNCKQRLAVLVAYFSPKGIDGRLRDVATISAMNLMEWRFSLKERKERYAGNHYRATIRGGLSDATIKTYVKEGYALFNWLASIGVLAESPAAKLKLPSATDHDLKYIRDDDLLAILEVAKVSPRDYALIVLLADTGMRAGELCTLTLDRLDLKHQVARVKGKSKRFSDCPFIDVTREALEAYLAVRPSAVATAVFLSRTRQALTPSAINRMLNEKAAAAGVTGPHNPHAFRHAAARAVLLSGGTLIDVKEKLHHTDIRVTVNHYAHLSNEEQRERLDRFSPMTRILKEQDLLTTQQQSEQVQKGEYTPPPLRVIADNRKRTRDGAL